MNREYLAEKIVERIVNEKDFCKVQYKNTASTIGCFFIDDLLPAEIVNEIANVFPDKTQMVLKKSLKEDKYVSAQMDKHDALLEEIIYAFQDIRVVRLIEEICGLKDIFPDDNLYAGGLSLMEKNQFLNPHLDNSHDKERQRWRVLNLLYYVTPDWKLEYGGNLELWPEGLSDNPVTIESKFNRLAVMATHNDSLHSVSKVEVTKNRCCVSNYYFSNDPLKKTDTFHVTSFRGRPNEKVKDIVLQFDNFLRQSLRKIFKKGIVENPHYYKNKNH
ncbi:2OG-Fe(II) oxygenase [Flavobacterium sp. H122]|uniref:2OG-Fe(II) oxygenase n=1 Tax=Flavobacterium sp. H122 TaxID=2529860 RepID=UPI0010A99AE6|nr:2OG-Fe(II) oxygenase [Flavobacterium sp. H122]